MSVNEASDSDSNKDPEYIPEEENSSNTDEDEKISSIRGKYAVLNHLCFKIGYNVVGNNLITKHTKITSNSYAISSMNSLHIILITVEKITVANSICLLV
jgi:hypothetical protein